ncbi:hypothetical protein M378DRAFT_1039533 [Amanita muscaria Koide BX008]|uniref:Pex19-domain-containing protein n=1 Tax=Amanita muscaria (strain Koide BX008) TaxID=946122 RepID=A0A0C2WTT8_AMAMK|nr:hypothetical protein M378DRAFT_1039533 [Amanita muscaria Koide BX008]
MATSSTHLKPKSVDIDDDLDELDGMFQSTHVLSEFHDTTEKQRGTSGRPRTNTRVAPPINAGATGRATGPPGDIPEGDEQAFPEAFARELAKGMEGLMLGGFDPSTLPPNDATDDDTENGESEEQRKETERAFRAVWEAMLLEGMNGTLDVETQSSADATGAGSSGANTNTTEGKRNDFQDRLKQAMDKMKETESNLQADSRPKEAEDPETLAELLKSIKGIGEGEEDETELAGFLEGIMGQLLSKEVLYDPLKELCDKFPNYLASPPSPLSAADRQRYEKQQACTKKILAIFDRPGYRDDDAESHQAIVEHMSEIQSYGSPPPELMGPLPSGGPLGPDGLPQLGENCVIS